MKIHHCIFTLLCVFLFWSSSESQNLRRIAWRSLSSPYQYPMGRILPVNNRMAVWLPLTVNNQHPRFFPSFFHLFHPEDPSAIHSNESPISVKISKPVPSNLQSEPKPEPINTPKDHVDDLTENHKDVKPDSLNTPEPKKEISSILHFLNLKNSEQKPETHIQPSIDSGPLVNIPKLESIAEPKPVENSNPKATMEPEPQTLENNELKKKVTYLESEPSHTMTDKHKPSAETKQVLDTTHASLVRSLLTPENGEYVSFNKEFSIARTPKFFLGYLLTPWNWNFFSTPEPESSSVKTQQPVPDDMTVNSDPVYSGPSYVVSKDGHISWNIDPRRNVDFMFRQAFVL